MVGILTEAAGALIASPVFQNKSDLRGARGLPSYAMTTSFPEPWPGGWWRLRDVVEYQKISCLALFTLAARYHDLFQDNYLRIGREAIERGRREPPFAWLVPPDQRDPRSAAHLLEILRETGIEIHQAEEAFTADGVNYPAGTRILHCAQPYRAHLIDMLERQKYPDRVQYPGGPAEQPYDIAGWTLSLQMGVRAVEVASPFEGRMRKLESIAAPPAELRGPENAAAYRLEAGNNDNYRLLNRLHKTGIEASIVHRAAVQASAPSGDAVPATIGTIYIHEGEKFRSRKEELLKNLSCMPTGVDKPNDALQQRLRRLRPPRTGLYQPWTASIDEGWTRLVLDNFEFSYRTVRNADIRAGNLRERYDCLILPSIGAASVVNGHAPDTTEPQYVGGIGEDGLVQLQDFVRAGGSLVCLDASCNLPIDHFNIPVKNLVRGKKTQEFFCPGSLLRVSIDPEHPIGYGLPEWFSGYFQQSQAFEVLETRSPAKGSRDPAARFPARVVARYSDTVLLESGWIRGGDLIADKPAIVEVQFGEGKIVLFGFRIQHRGQPHGTFRLLFNAIQQSTLGV